MCRPTKPFPFPFLCECFDDVYRILRANFGPMICWAFCPRGGVYPSRRRAPLVVKNDDDDDDDDDARMFLFSNMLLKSFDTIFIHRRRVVVVVSEHFHHRTCVGETQNAFAFVYISRAQNRILRFSLLLLIRHNLRERHT